MNDDARRRRSEGDNVNDDARRRVLLGLDGLIPLVWLEARERAARLGLPVTRDQLLPSEEERGALVEKLCMADDLALGTGRGKGSLAALARAIVALSAAPGGVKFLGRRWWLEEAEGGLTLREKAEEEDHVRPH